MNESYLTGFISTVKQAGYSEAQAINLFKEATGEDPSAMHAGAGAPPAALGQGQPPLPTGGEGQIPPEIEQLIQSLPPEVLQQLLAEVEAQMGGQGADGADPSAGGVPQGMPQHQGHLGHPDAQQKQGSEKPDLICKTAGYYEGFMTAAVESGVNPRQADGYYKQAVSQMEQSPIDPRLVLDSQEKRAEHYVGFVQTALQYGYNVKQAEEVYFSLFKQ